MPFSVTETTLTQLPDVMPFSVTETILTQLPKMSIILVGTAYVLHTTL